MISQVSRSLPVAAPCLFLHVMLFLHASLNLFLALYFACTVRRLELFDPRSSFCSQKHCALTNNRSLENSRRAVLMFSIVSFSNLIQEDILRMNSFRPVEQGRRAIMR